METCEGFFCRAGAESAGMDLRRSTLVMPIGREGSLWAKFHIGMGTGTYSVPPKMTSSIVSTGRQQTCRRADNVSPLNPSFQFMSRLADLCSDPLDDVLRSLIATKGSGGSGM